MQRNHRIQADKLCWRILAEGAPKPKETYDLAVAYLEGGATYYVADRVKARKKAAFVHIDYQKAGYGKDLDLDCYRKMDVVFSGDLLNQCIGSAFTMRNTGTPHLGLYGACSTMAESLLLASLAVSAGIADRAAAMTSSHFASSERQYRFPLGYGGQRTPTAQWTVTGSGAALVCSQGTGPKITACTIGSVTDLGIQDANNMGAAMAPAAFATIRQHLQDLQRTPEDYDLIVTGDLGQYGKELLLEIGRREGLSLGGKLADCGCMVFDNTRQDVHAGGSGCGCSAITLCGHLLGELSARKLKRILFCGTGALLSPTSTQQGLPIPGVCHAVVIEGG